MRAPLLGDVVAVGRSLKAVAPERRPRRLAQLLAAATVAERHRRQTGQSHPRYGDGSLIAAALARGTVPEPPLEDADYCLCLAMVLTALATRANSGAGPRGPLSS